MQRLQFRKSKYIFAKSLAFMLAGSTFLASGQPLFQSDNPYASIARRNIFGLVPLQSVETNQIDIQTPPPLITVCGTMTILGQPQALFRVAGIPKPGITVTETSHILAVGQKESNITLIHISSDGESITFDNNGIIQVLQLKTAPKPWKPDNTTAKIIGPIPKHFGSYMLTAQ